MELVEIRVYEDNAGGLHLVAVDTDGGAVAIQYGRDDAETAECIRAAIEDPDPDLIDQWDPQVPACEVAAVYAELQAGARLVWLDGPIDEASWGAEALRVLGWGPRSSSTAGVAEQADC